MAFSARAACDSGDENRNGDVAVGAMNDLDVLAREHVDDLVHYARRVAHAGADDRELRTSLAHAHRDVEIAEQRRMSLPRSPSTTNATPA